MKIKINKLYVIIFGVLLGLLISSFNSVNAINTCSTGFTVGSSYKEINCHSVCKKVKSNNANVYFAPTKTSSEWASFRNYIGGTVNITNCAPACTVTGVSVSQGSFNCSNGRSCGNWGNSSSSTWWINGSEKYGYTWHDTGFYQYIPITKTGVKYKLSFSSARYGAYGAYGNSRVNVGYYNSSKGYIGGSKSIKPTHDYHPSKTFSSQSIIMAVAPSTARYVRVHMARPGYYSETTPGGVKVDNFSLSTYCG